MIFSNKVLNKKKLIPLYGEGNNQAGIFEAEGNKSLIPGRLVRSPLNCPSTRKSAREKRRVSV